MQTYLNFLRTIINEGEDLMDRTGIGTRRVFSHEMTFDLAEGHFPLLTTKKVHFHSVVTELLWFLSGDTNISYLRDNNVRIWNEWADDNGDLGPVYGKQWRSWGCQDHSSVDQIKTLIHGLQTNPYSRRHIVSAWNVGELDAMALPPCHAFFQCFVSRDNRLSLKLTQRSADAFLGVPFNIASYSLLLLLLARECELKPGRFIWSGGDCHIYQNHFEQVKTQLERQPHTPPRVSVESHRSLFDLEIRDIVLHDYQPHPPIKAPIAV